MTQPAHLSIPAFFVGQRVRLYVRSYQNNVLTDPTEVTIMHRDPSGNEASEIYNGGAGNVVKHAGGIYYLDLTLDEKGTWAWRSKTTGLIATKEQQIIVYESYFDSP